MDEEERELGMFLNQSMDEEERELGMFLNQSMDEEERELGMFLNQSMDEEEREQGLGYRKLGSMKAVSYIPPDILVEILKRLPAKSILRFRSVCKSWYSLTQEHHFINQCIEWRRSNLPRFGVITLSQFPPGSDFALHYFSGGWCKFDMTSLDKGEFYYISNSCNGLICVYSWSFIYVVNPFLREVLVLPEHKPYTIGVALVHDESSNRYKVVRLFRRLWGYKRIRCEIFTLGSHSWRAIGKPPLQIQNYSLPLVVSGAIHWPTTCDPRTGKAIAIAFDIKNEDFKVVMHPKTFSDFEQTELTEFGGKLCVSVIDERKPWQSWIREIWILSNYRKCEWTKEIFYLGLMNKLSPHVASNTIPIAVNKGKIVWSTRFGRYDIYDPIRRMFEKPIYHQTDGSAVPFVESLVSPIEIHEKGTGCRQPKWAALKWKSRREWGRGLLCSEQLWDNRD